MTSEQLQGALGLTIAGFGTAFLSLTFLMLLIMGMALVFKTRFVRKRTGALAAEEAATARRNRALAATIAVSAALASADYTTGSQTAQEDTSV